MQQQVCYKIVTNELLPFQGVQLGVSPPAADPVLTAEGQQARVGDWGLTQVQHLEHSEVFRQEPQAGVSKLWGTWVLSFSGSRGGNLRLGAGVGGGGIWLAMAFFSEFQI